jgi:hypothetical protein
MLFALTRRLGEAIGDLALAIGVCDRPDAIADEVESLVRLPAGWFLQYPSWPSGLASDGTPFELSLSIQDGKPSIRHVVDVTDHTPGVGGNWNSYLAYAQLLTGEPTDSIHSQLVEHLNGIPPTIRTPLLVGAGYGLAGVRRASLYFNTQWLPYERFKAKFGECTNRIERNISKYGGCRPSQIH